ncbi:hypothetical protein LB518_09905 [Mesorhizobium sp. BR1-1-16]|uniref:COG4315 family predicted lipoprotein n=1 Tax=Mesorhizobium sp. BR1-1-16 TaxID=2876653 RepID=UPI001CCC771D|nr:hypothetical protein [Mesorhizobium sp. BR1-1-16]MBZ9936609.1 hypothetical protein [Mesorhizobium sp. BR1-1-16]
MLKIITASMLAISLAGVSVANAKTVEPAKVVTIGKEILLADAKGMTLYTYDKDTAGKSDCTLLCAAAWPPLMAKAGAKASGEWSLVKRANGSMQWAYKGAPLYTYRLDTRPGATSGEGVEGEWHIAKP